MTTAKRPPGTRSGGKTGWYSTPNELRRRKHCTYTLPEITSVLIDTMAKFDGISRGKLVEDAVNFYFANRPRPKPAD